MREKEAVKQHNSGSSWTRCHYISAVLLPLVLLSAFLVVYSKDLNRRLFIQYQSLQQQATNLRVQHGKLLLEQSAWSAQARVQRIAQQQLHMQLPTANQIVIVQPQTPNDVTGDH